MKIRIVVFDEHEDFLDSVLALLKTHDGIDVVAGMNNGNTLVELAQKLRPDVMVLDVGLPFKVKSEAIRTFIREVPGVKVLALGMETNKQLIAHVLEAGAGGYVCKDRVLEELVPAIRTVAAGHGQINACLHAAHHDKKGTRKPGI